MRITIITPTVQRPSLVACCESVNHQTFKGWEHIVQIDKAVMDDPLIFSLAHPKRQFHQCYWEHKNGGNTCRHEAWKHATGDWVYHLDDDNHLADDEVLERLAEALEGIEEKWAIFPIHRHGWKFYFDPPKPCYFDTGNAIVKREIAQWPDIDDYASDAVWLEALKAKEPYKALPNLAPIMVMPGTSFGSGGGINGQ